MTDCPNCGTHIPNNTLKIFLWCFGGFLVLTTVIPFAAIALIAGIAMIGGSAEHHSKHVAEMNGKHHPPAVVMQHHEEE